VEIVIVLLLAFALLALVVAVVVAPLRSARSEEESPSADLGELEAARESKYHEVRDAELDFRTGKLSREDYERVDGALRGEALEILDELHRLQEPDRAAPDASTRTDTDPTREGPGDPRSKSEAAGPDEPGAQAGDDEGI
jgi:hypothetical protein